LYIDEVDLQFRQRGIGKLLTAGRCPAVMKVLTFQVRSDAKIKNYNPSELSDVSFSADLK
jgi:hypothetical protein